MPDPLSLIAMGAAVGGAAGKFVEKAWDSGEKWITTYYENHQEKAKEKATQNSAKFLNDLAIRLKSLEEQKQVTPEQIVQAQEQPDFSVILQKALLSSAQTDNSQKHQLLSRLVSERVKSSSESLMSLASKMACDAISYTTPNQLKILGLTSNLFHVVPNDEFKGDKFYIWLEKRFRPFIGTSATNLDYSHLEALSCLKFESFLTRDLIALLSEKNGGEFINELFQKTDYGQFLTDIWEKQCLKSVQLTSVGQIIGILSSDQITGQLTNINGWE